jgi:hypothetical protein
MGRRERNGVSKKERNKERRKVGEEGEEQGEGRGRRGRRKEVKHLLIDGKTRFDV